MTRTDLYGPRARSSSVWCCRFLRCDGIDVPGWIGNGEGEMCDACEAERLKAEPEPREETDHARDGDPVHVQP